MTVRLPADLAAQLEKLTLSTGKDQTAITVAALRDYLAVEVWRVRDVEDGIAEADRGDFASPEEVSAFFAKYGA